MEVQPHDLRRVDHNRERQISTLKSARVAQLTEKNGMLEKDISASKPKLHESRGEEANADREKLQAER